jgi:hypothetical protein
MNFCGAIIKKILPKLISIIVVIIIITIITADDKQCKFHTFHVNCNDDCNPFKASHFRLILPNNLNSTPQNMISSCNNKFSLAIYKITTQLL